MQVLQIVALFPDFPEWRWGHKNVNLPIIL